MGKRLFPVYYQSRYWLDMADCVVGTISHYFFLLIYLSLLALSALVLMLVKQVGANDSEPNLQKCSTSRSWLR